jgi:uncharacterized membrane protein YbhN (UPF0104 family)
MIQNTQESVPKTSILSEKLFLSLKWLIFGLIVLLSYNALAKEFVKISDLFEVLKKAIVWDNALKIIFLIILILINWGFEAKKWQILARKIENITFKEAYQSVLIGLSLGFVTPANLGDYAGKIWQLKSKNKTESIGAILLGNGIQFYVSLIFGEIAYLILWKQEITTFDQILFCLIAFTLILGIIIYNYKVKIIGFLPRFSWLKTFEKHFQMMIKFDSDEIRHLFIWSILRYLTFSLQFVLALLIFKVNIHFIDLWAISCLVFLFKTIIPAINFVSDLGVREYTAVHFFSLFSVNVSSVVMATFCLWFLNILLPVVFGGLLVLRIKNK